MNHIKKSIPFILPVAALALIVLQVVVSNDLATLNAHLGSLDSEMARARSRHETLETAVASASSLMTMREQALAAGFREPTSRQVVVLQPEVPVAFGAQYTAPDTR